LAVIVSRTGEIPFDIPLFSDPGSRVALYAPSGTAIPDCAAEIIRHDPPSPGERLGAADMLVGVMRSLREDHGVGSLLCEGGPMMFNAMLLENLVDELFLTLAPALVGGGELSITAGSAMPNPLPLQLIWALEQEGSLFLRYARAGSIGSFATGNHV
jgi:5-amino-6-(5-phosphoribosylamino)uracil reductase